MGNEIGKKYDVDLKDPCASGGHNMAWKVFRARRKKDGLLCSVFLFEKDLLKGMEKVRMVDVQLYALA